MIHQPSTKDITRKGLQVHLWQEIEKLKSSTECHSGKCPRVEGDQDQGQEGTEHKGFMTVQTRPRLTCQGTDTENQPVRVPTPRSRARFPVKGARDVLRDFEAGIGATDRTGPFAFTTDPRDH